VGTPQNITSLHYIGFYARAFGLLPWFLSTGCPWSTQNPQPCSETGFIWEKQAHVLQLISSENTETLWGNEQATITADGPALFEAPGVPHDKIVELIVSCSLLLCNVSTFEKIIQVYVWSSHFVDAGCLPLALG
jgi:hypothetical protein